MGVGAVFAQERDTMTNTTTDLLCFGDDWDLASEHHESLARFARDRRVFFIEAPRFANSHPYMPLRSIRPNVWAARPYLTQGTNSREQHFQLCGQLSLLALDMRIVRPIIWYMQAGRWPAMPQISASLVVCGPMAEDAASWDELVEQADLVLPEQVAAAAGAPADAFYPGLLRANGTPAQRQASW